MSANLPEVLDAWRMVAARRGVEGRLPLSTLARLRDSLVDTEGEVVFALDFGQDALRVPYVELRIDAELPLLCQRTLQRFLFPVQIVQRLGLIREESGRSRAAGRLRAAADAGRRHAADRRAGRGRIDPRRPGRADDARTEAMERDWPAEEAELERVNPFAALSALKNKSN